MHILILSKRNGRAQERMLAAAKAIGRVAGIDPALIEALNPRAKDPAIRAMEQREAIADLLEALAIAANIPLTEPADDEQPAEAPAADVTTVTPPEQEAVNLPESTESATDEALPSPVLEEGEEGRADGGLVRGDAYYNVSEPNPDEQFVPSDEQPAEAPAADESKPKGKRSPGKKK